MICIACKKEKDAAAMGPGCSAIAPVCIQCIDERVAEKAKEQANEMVVSTTRRTADQTPEQLRPDERCQWCRAGRWHSEWAHVDALEEFHTLVEGYNVELVEGEAAMTQDEMAGIMIG